MPDITGYVVVTSDAKLKTRRRHVEFFKTEKGAVAFASSPGDSVLMVTVPMGREPVFIRSVAL